MADTESFTLGRREFEDLMFGGRGALRFTQDSPVLPEVWTLYADRPGERLDLLLTPFDDGSPSELAAALRDRLPDGARPRLAYTGTYVAAELTLEELIRAALPLSKWWQPSDAGDYAGPAQRDWLATLLGAVLVVREHGGLEGTEAPPVTLGKLKQMGAKLLPPPAAAGERALLWQVAHNRDAEIALVSSRQTVKADAANRLFEIDCADLAWAVIDSGIDATHMAFRLRDDGVPRKKEFESRVVATYDFTRLRAAQAYAFSGEAPDDPALRRLVRRHSALLQDLSDDLSSKRPLNWTALEPVLRIPHGRGYAPPPVDHGTHVAGIIAGDWPEERLVGICPQLQLYDLRVVDADGKADEFAVHAAMQFIDHLNGFGRWTIVHGANVSMSLRHHVKSFACGETPVCREANRLVDSGVVVVVAAGNLGRAEYVLEGRVAEGYRMMSITDPGNAEKVITVGATHRSNPHSYGVSYFSSRGPTGDGRPKPDLVAPGEKITAPVPEGLSDEKDGTSQAAPHVSGAAALLLGRYRELIGHPERVKRVLCATATDLGRERAFQGAGLVDVLRALQEF